MKRDEGLAVVAVILCGALWGLFWIPVHWLEGRAVGGAWVSVIFAAVSALATVPWLLRKGAWTGYATQGVAGLLIGGGFALYTVSLVLTNVVHAILLFYLLPVWATLAAWLLRGETLTSSRLLALALGLAGMVCVLGPGHGLPVPHTPGDWLALASGMFWAAGSTLSFTRPTHAIALPVFAFSTGSLAFSLVIAAIASGLGHPLAEAEGMLPVLPMIAVLALTMFTLPNLLVLWATQRIDPGRVGILLTTEVLVGAISAAALSGETFGWAEMAGTVMVIAAGLMEILRRA